MVKKPLCQYAILVASIGIAFFGRPPAPARAADCWATVLCSFPGGSTYTNVQSWPNGSWPFSARQWSTCNANCNSYVAGLDLQGMATDRKVCGTVECTATHRLGARPERACDGRRVQVACPTGPPGPPGPTGPDQGQNTDSQYAAKFVCGPSATQPLVEDGDYKTTINIHNPQYQAIDFRYKAASAGVAADGPISSFVLGKIGPDAAQAFDCDTIRGLFSPPPGGLIDGFLVFQSGSPLDVTGYYTASRPTQNVTAIHIEKFAARAVPAYDSLCQKNVSIKLEDVSNWQTSSGTPAVVVTPIPGWDTTRPWMSYQTDGRPGTYKDFTYQLDFCSCSSSKVQITGDVKSDNAARGDLNTTLNHMPQPTQIFDTGSPFPSGNGNYAPSPTNQAISISGTPVYVDAGSGNIVITVHNDGGPTGVSVTGTLNLPEGHVGPCRP